MTIDTSAIPPYTLIAEGLEGGARRWLVVTPDGARELGEGVGLGELLGGDAEAFRAALAAARPVPHRAVRLAAPVDSDTEVWAAGVTYTVSREARMEESEQSADVYEQVYDAERPELFFKAVGWRVSGPGEAVGVRADSTWDVPEPELAVVCAASGEIVGATVCNDVSSRSIEGENPLYLPQAKVYRGSCAIGPWIRLAEGVGDLLTLGIEAAIERDGGPLWKGDTTTARLHRTPAELADWLFRGDDFPRGAVLSTGTSAVPGPEVTLEAGDRVVIDIEGIGRLANPVLRGKAGFGR
ncbi:fumarylacetoacetate hydrolase [Streptomyces sp. A7024]|uniref:Fumarylacetoacetate hydrolase n=1 Tax=Streptomyces coryli TaxID=1128680 RepID=A0A6G4TWW5_9ACTN|nr:fumarylacetoacetate hydrolase family protein [Streptomyces coryli]NGN64272.1 fumarylacetoacetate hydrolase [Streptomyces coryli]